MSHRESEIVLDGGTKERKGALSLIFFGLEYKISDYQQKSGECMMGCTVQGGQKGKEVQCR